MSQQADTIDVLVVGSGVAGLSAAVTALESGLRVTVLERSVEEEFGGNSRWTEAYVRMKNDTEISDDFEEQFAMNAGANLDPNVLDAVGGAYEHWPAYVKAHGLPDPEVISRFAESVAPTVAWLKGFGLRFEPQPIYHLTQHTTRIASKGGGLAIIERLAEEAKKLGATFLYRTTAVDLLRASDGKIEGVMVSDPAGKRREVRANATILASGGYQGNPEMLTRYMGTRARYIRPVAVGGYHDKGEGISMALNAGAAPAGDFSSYHSEPIDPRSRQPGAVVFIYPYGVLVNKHGKRFLDEAPGASDASYDNITRAIAEQYDGISYTIFDSKVEEIPRWKTSIRSEVQPVTAATLEELIAKLGLPVDATLESISAYNDACPASGTYSPLELDGLATSGVWPPKSNWSRPIDKGPFFAFPIMSGNCFTFGGLKVNTDAQVLDNDGKPMQGLYAAGETVGLYHQVYTGSTSVLRGLVFGRLAAKHAAGSQ
jgi:tricarballylate dehydrogenase